jgi:galactokinase
MDGSIEMKLASDFSRNFSGRPLIVRSPGRVNIIGEHTDYNNGFVLPAAIDRSIMVAVVPREDETIRLYSGEFEKHHETTLSSMKPSPEVWPNYILGVADQLKKRGYSLRGFDLAIDGDVPIGSGLSSSAAVECATALALNQIFQLRIPRMELAFIAQKAEHEFAGVMCGIMDQFASLFGKKDHVIRLDCQSMAYEYVPLRLNELRIVLLNTNVKHSLASSEYNTRRQQCEKGVALVREKVPGVKSLRDVSMEMLEQYVAKQDPLVYQRCRYVVEENERLLQGCADLERGDIKGLGEKMFRSHEGLSRQYEVSCRELDFLVDQVRKNPAVLGARMMGGGFGGCTINLVKENAIESLVKTLTPAYEKEMGHQLTAYVASTDDGTSIIRH